MKITLSVSELEQMIKGKIKESFPMYDVVKVDYRDGPDNMESTANIYFDHINIEMKEHKSKEDV